MQFDVFTGYIQTGAITLSTAGTIDLSNADVFTSTITLSGAGNKLTPSDEGRAYYTVDGGNGADTVTVVGGTTHVVLNGNGGGDTLAGGSGADRFVFAGTANGLDTITDFSGLTAFAGGAGEGDRPVLQGLLAGTFAYRGASAFTATGNTERGWTAGMYWWTRTAMAAPTSTSR